MQTSLKRLGFQFSTRKDMSAKFPRGGGGANPFSAIRLYVIYIPNTTISVFIELIYARANYLLYTSSEGSDETAQMYKRV